MSISIEAHDRICQDLHQQMRSLIVENERLKAAAQQALEAMRCAVPTGKITLYAWDKAMAALRAALAESAPDWSICPACGGMASDPIVPQRPAEPVQDWNQP